MFILLHPPAYVSILPLNLILPLTWPTNINLQLDYTNKGPTILWGPFVLSVIHNLEVEAELVDVFPGMVQLCACEKGLGEEESWYTEYSRHVLYHTSWQQSKELWPRAFWHLGKKHNKQISGHP